MAPGKRFSFAAAAFPGFKPARDCMAHEGPQMPDAWILLLQNEHLQADPELWASIMTACPAGQQWALKEARHLYLALDVSLAPEDLKEAKEAVAKYISLRWAKPTATHDTSPITLHLVAESSPFIDNDTAAYNRCITRVKTNIFRNPDVYVCNEEMRRVKHIVVGSKPAPANPAPATPAAASTSSRPAPPAAKPAPAPMSARDRTWAAFIRDSGVQHLAFTDPIDDKWLPAIIDNAPRTLTTLTVPSYDVRANDIGHKVCQWRHLVITGRAGQAVTSVCTQGLGMGPHPAPGRTLHIQLPDNGRLGFVAYGNGLVSSVQRRWRRWRVHTRDGNGVPIALKYKCAETGIPPGPEEQVHTLTSALLQVEEHNAYLQSRGRPQFQHKVTLFDWTLTPELMGVMAQFIDWEFKIGQCITPLFGDLLLSHVFCAPTTNLHVLRLHNVNLTREVALHIVLYVRSLKQLAVRAATPDGDISHFKFERLESLQLFDGVRDAKLHWLPRPLAGQYQIFIGQENVWHMTVYAHVAITALQQKGRPDAAVLTCISPDLHPHEQPAALTDVMPTAPGPQVYLNGFTITRALMDLADTYMQHHPCEIHMNDTIIWPDEICHITSAPPIARIELVGVCDPEAPSSGGERGGPWRLHSGRLLEAAAQFTATQIVTKNCVLVFNGSMFSSADEVADIAARLPEQINATYCFEPPERGMQSEAQAAALRNGLAMATHFPRPHVIKYSGDWVINHAWVDVLAEVSGDEYQDTGLVPGLKVVLAPDPWPEPEPIAPFWEEPSFNALQRLGRVLPKNKQWEVDNTCGLKNCASLLKDVREVSSFNVVTDTPLKELNQWLRSELDVFIELPYLSTSPPPPPAQLGPDAAHDSLTKWECELVEAALWAEARVAEEDSKGMIADADAARGWAAAAETQAQAAEVALGAAQAGGWLEGAAAWAAEAQAQTAEAARCTALAERYAGGGARCAMRAKRLVRRAREAEALVTRLEMQPVAGPAAQHAFTVHRKSAGRLWESVLLEDANGS